MLVDFLDPEIRYDVFGSASRRRVLEICQGAQWIKINENREISITDNGIKIIEKGSRKDIIRRQLRSIIFHLQPPWAKKIQYGRSELLKTVNPDIKQCFEEASLAYDIDQETVMWWDILAEAARGNLHSELLKTGRIGERLTLEYEAKRTGHVAKYIALETSLPGYDILSRVSRDDNSNLCIEVKSSTQSINNATFHLTRNEFNKAKMSKNYIFHLWLISEDVRTDPCIITVEDIMPHCPVNQGSGSWESVEIPFKAFSWV